MVAAIGMLPQPVLAESDKIDQPWERLSIKLGWFIAGLNTDARIGSKELGLGLNLDLEEALGLETTQSVFRADALYRFGKSRRHRWDFSYYDFRRSATKTLKTDVEFNGETIRIGTTADSFFNIRIFRLGYSYSFFHDDRFDIAGSAGLFIMPLEIGISASGLANEDQSITAPLPTIGMRAEFALTPKLFLSQDLQLFWLKYQSFRGGMVSTRTAIEYNAWKNFGLGLGFDAFHLAIEAENEDYPGVDFAGNIKFDYTGLLLYAKFYL